jgi:hypothetical protein
MKIVLKSKQWKVIIQFQRILKVLSFNRSDKFFEALHLLD